MWRLGWRHAEKLGRALGVIHTLFADDLRFRACGGNEDKPLDRGSR